MKDQKEIDVIILSYAQNENLKVATEFCLYSLMNSEDPEKVKFNVIVLESNKAIKPFQYEYGRTIYPDEEFGYHTYMNIGIDMTSSPFLCLCNNDLLFHPNWATEILTAMELHPELSSASPICPIYHPQVGYQLNTGIYPGYRIGKEISGWCILLKREILKLTGKPDPNYKFWCADNDYANTLWVLNLKHALISSSMVDHMEMLTLRQQSNEKQVELTEKALTYYERKWNHRMGIGWILQV